MKPFKGVVKLLSTLMSGISAVFLVAITFITCLDVILRRFGFPLDFPYEVVCSLAGVVICFAVPETTLTKTHVRVEYLDAKLSEPWLKVINAFCKLVGIVVFAIICWSSIGMGRRFLQSGQHTAILKIPEWPLPVALAASCIVQCLVLFLLYNLNKKSEEERQ
jgi:TRAP-type C4-dicarboxylate transport system permease small subunit